MAPERKRPTRSQLYQHLLVEKAFSHEMMETFSNDDSVYKKLNPFDYNEEILILEDQLKERFWKIINEHLTPRQLEIVKLLRDGATQQEAARKLGVNQSSITKCLASDTLLHFRNQKISIGDVYHNWNKSTDELPLLCVNESTKELVETKIVNVMRGNIKQLIRVTTASGKTIRASSDHKFFTNKNWLRLEDAISSKSLLAVNNDGIIKLEEIKSFKNDGVEETFDIEVLDPWHNFIADNFVVHNSINGNVDYSKDNGKASYGGICKKLARVVDKDPAIKEIMQKISDLRNDTWI